MLRRMADGVAVELLERRRAAREREQPRANHHALGEALRAVVEREQEAAGRVREALGPAPVDVRRHLALEPEAVVDELLEPQRRRAERPPGRRLEALDRQRALRV